MAKLTEAIQKAKEKDEAFFFGEGNVKHTSNKYFEFKHKLDDDNVIVLTNNIRTVKDNPVLVVGNSSAVYLKTWQIRKVHNFDNGIDTMAVKLNRRFFKTYTFRSEFEGIAIEGIQTFDDFVKTAEKQDADNMAVANGHMGA